jgi:PAS domain S-box-containing protein
VFVYLLISVLLGSVLLSVRSTVALAVAHMVGIFLLHTAAPQIATPVLINALLIVGFFSMLIVVATHVHQRDLAYIERQAREITRREERFQALVANSSDAITLFAPDGTVIYDSPAAPGMLGYTPDELVGLNALEHVHPDDAPRIQALFGHLARQPDTRTTAEFRFKHKDGAWRWLEAVATNLLDNPSVQAIVANYRDITPRKLAEAALRQAEQRYRNLFEQAPLMYVVTHNRGGAPVITDCNEAFVNTLGYARAEVIGRPLTDFYTAESTARLQAGGYRRALEGTFEFEERELLTRDGQVLDTLLRAVPESDADGHIIGTLAMYVDITQRKLAERKVQESEERYRLLVQQSVDAIYLYDPDTLRLHEANPAFLDLLGYSAEEVPQLTLYDFVAHERQSIDAHLKPVLPQGPMVIGERRWRRKDGSLVDVAVSVSKIHQGDQEVLFVIAHDITERKRVEWETRRRVEQFEALHNIQTAISGSTDLHLVLNVLLDHVTAQLDVDAADVLIFDPATQGLAFAAGRGFRTAALQHSRLRVGEGYAGQVALERRPVHVPDLRRAINGFQRSPLLPQEDFIEYHGLPLVAKGQLVGVMEIFQRASVARSQGWLDFLNVLAGQAAIAIDNARLFEGFQRANVELTLAYDATLEGWSRALDLRDKETEGHTQRVTEMTLRLARAMGMSEGELVQMRRGALLHDIGKMGIPDSILLKPGPLTDEEWGVMRQHPALAHEMLSPIVHLRPALDIPYCHHEKWDGTGYPRGLKGEQIPLAARIFAVVDVWDALRSDRPYRPAWPAETAREHIRSLAGTHFDPRVVEAFLNLLTV